MHRVQHVHFRLRKKAAANSRKPKWVIPDLQDQAVRKVMGAFEETDTVDELRQKCSRIGAPISGPSEVLRMRLKLHSEVGELDDWSVGRVVEAVKTVGWSDHVRVDSDNLEMAVRRIQTFVRNARWLELMDEDMLREECLIRGLESEGSRDELIRSIKAHVWEPPAA